MRTKPPRDLLIVASALFLWGIGEGMFSYFQPLYLKEWGADPILIGGILSAMGIWMTVANSATAAVPVDGNSETPRRKV